MVIQKISWLEKDDISRLNWYTIINSVIINSKNILNNSQISFTQTRKG